MCVFSLLVRGGLNEVYRLFWSKAESKKEIMHYLDKNAAYCFMAMINFFPIGPYKILTFYNLQNIKFNGAHFQLNNGQEIYGLALVRVLCPSKILIPFLSYRSSLTGKNCLPCCKTCADSQTLDCNHTTEYVLTKLTKRLV